MAFAVAKPLVTKVAATKRASAVKPVAAFSVERAAKGAATAIATLGLALSAHAADVKLGSDNGSLVFEPSSITIKAGDSVTFKNNAGFPHNIVFDEDAVPEGVKVDAISHEDYLNAPGETYTVKLTTPGEYGFYCEPHQGAGMQGKITVQ